MYAYKILRIAEPRQTEQELEAELRGRGNGQLWIHDGFERVAIPGPNGVEDYLKIVAYQDIARPRHYVSRGANGATIQGQLVDHENEEYNFFYPLGRSTLALLVGGREIEDLDAHFQVPGRNQNQHVLRALAARKAYNITQIMQNYQTLWKRGFHRRGAAVRAVMSWGQFTPADPILHTIAAQSVSTSVGITLNLGGVDRKVTVFADGRIQVMLPRLQSSDPGLLGLISEAAHRLQAFEQ